MKKVHCLYVLSFISAFLLFQIELVIAKIFLPKFGGSYLVWGACMVFFQFSLLLGYLYSHVVIRKFGMFKYRYAHLAIVALPLLFFPGRPLPDITSHSQIPLVIDVFLQLMRTIGLAFFVLSTISIVTQSWLANSRLPEQRNPYMLYAISNIGSFMALLTYPFLIEAYFDLDTQIAIWRILYGVFLLFYVISLFVIEATDKAVPAFNIFSNSLFRKRYSFDDEKVRQKIYWFLLSAAGCIIFLSVTNIVTYEIAPCPLLWIIPLCIYLASFALTFRDKPLYPKWIPDKFHLVLGFSILLYFFAQEKILPISPQIIAFTVFLFALCMFCQHELYQTRPQKKDDLTIFYLVIAIGGFMGSLLVTWVAPLLFTLPFEFLLGLYVIALSLRIKIGRSRLDFYQARLIVYVITLLIVWPLVFEKYNVFGITLIFVCFSFLFRDLVKKMTALSWCLFIIVVLAPFSDLNWEKDGKVIRAYRNYYGIYTINVRPPLLKLMNGTTLHGAQYLSNDKAKASEPLIYYHRETPVGKLLTSDLFPTGHVGIVGLGVGALSAYGKKGEVMDFFELDPDMSFIAKEFTHLDNAKAKLNFFYEDARLALMKIPHHQYDILIVDAFTGDSVPVHLLTTEAIREYQLHMKEKGIILFHISNRYLDIAPVLFSNAREVKAFSLLNLNEMKDAALQASMWVALTWDNGVSDTLSSQLKWQGNAVQLRMRNIRPWTDKYSNIPLALKPDVLISSIKTFSPFFW